MASKNVCEYESAGSDNLYDNRLNSRIERSNESCHHFYNWIVAFTLLIRLVVEDQV